jgi:proteasome-associated ATPase
MDPMTEWVSTGSLAAFERVSEMCRRDPYVMSQVLERYRELQRALQQRDQLLAEAKEALEEKQNGVLHVAVFIGVGPLEEKGAPTAIVDRGGQRCVVPLAAGVRLDELREKPTVLLNADSVVVGTLSDYAPPGEVGRVVEVSNGHALVEFHADEQVRVDVAHGLRGQMREGDRALVDRRHGLVIGRMGAVESQAEWLLEESPPERFSDVAAQDGAIRHIVERVFYPLQRPELMELLRLKPAVGILLYGPTGCGKTLIGRATAGELKTQLGVECAFIRVKAGALKSKWYGETTQRIQRLWKFAREESKKGKVVIIFLDECDSLGSARAANGGEYGMRADHDATNAWLGEMEGIDTDRSQRIVCMASSNFERNLDSAFLGRFALKIPVRRPDADGADRMFRIHLNHGGVPMEASLDQTIEKVVDFVFHDKNNALLNAHLRDGKQMETIRRSHLITGRLVRDSVEQAKWLVVRDVVENGDQPVLRTTHLLRAGGTGVGNGAQDDGVERLRFRRPAPPSGWSGGTARARRDGFGRRQYVE